MTEPTHLPKTSPEVAPKSPPQKRRFPLWRWAWIGFALSAVLWFGSTTYFQRIQQIDDIEYASGNYEDSEVVAKNKSNMRSLMACQIGAGVIALASLTCLVSQADFHRPRPHQ